MSLNSALRGLHPKKKSMEARMRRVSLGITVYLFWRKETSGTLKGKPEVLI